MEVPRVSGQGDSGEACARAEGMTEAARRVDSRGVRCRRRFWHLASSALGRLVHRETRVPTQGGTPFAASRRLTSPRVPTSKSLIMATRPRPPPPEYIPSEVRGASKTGLPIFIRIDAKLRNNFTKTLPRTYVLAVNRKYDDCHGVPRPPRRNLRVTGIILVNRPLISTVCESHSIKKLAAAKNELLAKFSGNNKPDLQHNEMKYVKCSLLARPVCARSIRLRAPFNHFLRESPPI